MKTLLKEEEVCRIREIREDLHRHPEISGREVRTTAEIRRILAQIPGIRILELPLATGTAAVLQGTGERQGADAAACVREVALRADIDAIPQTEQAEVPWKSEQPGVMHACGHDCHTAGLLGAAMALGRMRDRLSGQVDLIFQPSEEITRGAKEMLDAGLFGQIHPQRIYGIHNWPSVPAGRIVAQAGPRMAAKINFRVRIIGRGGHGSEPQNNIDPIVCASAVVQSLQTVVSRNMAPMDHVVLSVNSIRGGSEQNLVVDDTVMTATIRAVQQTAMDHAWERTKTIIQSTAAAYECRAEISVEDRIPAVVNPAEQEEEAQKIARLSGTEALPGSSVLCDAPPALASEDFSLYYEKAPSWFYWVGSGIPGRENAPLHSPRFCPDEGTPERIARLFVSAALFHLGGSAGRGKENGS